MSTALAPPALTSGLGMGEKDTGGGRSARMEWPAMILVAGRSWSRGMFYAQRDDKIRRVC